MQLTEHVSAMSQARSKPGVTDDQLWVMTTRSGTIEVMAVGIQLR